MRVLSRNPGFGVLAILTLALGIGTATAIFSVVYAVVIRPLPFPDEDRLVVLWKMDTVTKSPFVELAHPEFEDWRAQARSFSSLAAMPTTPYGYGYVLTGRDEPVLVESSKVTGRFFSALAITPELGRGLDESDDRPEAPKVAVLSHRLWRERFDSDPGIIGRVITLTGEPHVVVGVMPQVFEFPKGVDLWLPFATSTNRRAAEDRGVVFLQAVGRLKAGVSLDAAEAELNAIIARVANDHPETEAGGHRVVITRLPDHLLGNARHALWLLLAATGLLLLIASTNVANLFLARATTRRRELALRASLGAGRVRVASQLASESLVLALLGGGFGLFLAKALTVWLVRLAPSDIPRIEDVTLQGTVLAFALLVSLFTALFFGLAPAFASARLNLGEAMREGSGGRHSLGRKGKRLRAALIAGEVAVAVVLLCGGALLLRSMVNLTSVDLGLERRNVLTLQLRPKGEKYREPEAVRQFFRQLIEKLEDQPGVLAASAVLVRPLEGTVGWDAEYEGEGQAEGEARTNPIANFEVVTPHYFRVFGIPFRSGREFSPNDTMDRPRVAILSESLAKRLFGSPESAVGKRLKLWPGSPDSPFRTIVGVVSDVRYRELEEVRLDIYVPLEQSESAIINHLALRTASDPEPFLATVRREVASLDPFQAVASVATMEDLVATREARPRFNAVLLNWLSGFALLLAVVGVHGVVAYSTAERTSEMGLRMALGSSASGILKLVIAEGMRPVLAGIAIGFSAALFLGRWIAALLFQVDPTDVPTFLGVAAVLLSSALLACWIPAARAAKMDPMLALRRE